MQINLAQALGLVVERSHTPTPQGQVVPLAFPHRCCLDMSQVLLGAGVPAQASQLEGGGLWRDLLCWGIPFSGGPMRGQVLGL